MRPTPPTAKLEDLARTLTSAPDVDLKDFAATRRGLLLRAASRRAAGRALPRSRTRDRSEPDASHAARSDASGSRWNAGGPTGSMESAAVFGAIDKPGPYVVLVQAGIRAS